MWRRTKRCEPRSACAQKASLLLAQLEQIDQDASSFWLSHTQAQAYWQDVPVDLRDAIWEQTLDDPEYHLLTHYSCTAFATLVVTEAGCQLGDPDWLLHEDAEIKSQIEQHHRSWLRVLRVLLSKVPVIPHNLDRILAWYLPQQRGHGMESLAALHAQTKKKLVFS